jgi:hypothetical protein
MIYKVVRNLNHNCTEFPVGSEIDLNPSEPVTLTLLDNGIIEKMSRSQREDENREKIPTKPVERFNSPTSAPELERRMEELKNRRIYQKCPKCKEKRELVDKEITVKGRNVTTLGKCIICGTQISRRKTYLTIEAAKQLKDNVE